jgi:MFS transporter, OCT family, solute carrier family 22 (organic cation transporter), member 4/5
MSFVADNFGRKLALVIAWTICVCGSILVVFGFHIFPVTLGLFLSGFGGDAANSITLLFFCEVLNNRKRQQYSVIVQIFFTIGALVATVLFYIINSWRIVWSVLVIIPALVELVMLYSYI